MLCTSLLFSASCSFFQSVKKCEKHVTSQRERLLLGRPHTCLITSCWRGAVVTLDKSTYTEPMDSCSYSCTLNNPLTVCRHHALDEIVFLDVYLLRGETRWVVAKYSLFLFQKCTSDSKWNLDTPWSSHLSRKRCHLLAGAESTREDSCVIKILTRSSQSKIL